MPFVYPLRVNYFDAVSILMFYYNFGEINSFFLSLNKCGIQDSKKIS